MRPERDLAVVIPALDEREALPRLLADLKRERFPAEVIVVDGGSSDGTPEIATAMGARVIGAPRCRGAQLQAGTDATASPLLWFLHADSRLPPAGPRLVCDMGADPRLLLGAFRLRIEGSTRGPAHRAGLRLIEAVANARSVVLGMPYGDQGYFLRREVLQRAGGFRALPRCEDLDLLLRLRTLAAAPGEARPRVRIAPLRLASSSRRWDREGALAVTLRNWRDAAAFVLCSPHRRGARSAPAEEIAHGIEVHG